ncbi:MAG: D-alanyl-D-alanine carboxypeptidase family protein [Solirubrobacterales bacterium]
MRWGRSAAAALLAAVLLVCALAPAASGTERQGDREAPGTAKKKKKKQQHKQTKKKKAPIPGPPVDARSWALIDARTGDVIVAHDGRRRLPIASTTKLMTAWVTLKEARLGEIVRAQPYEAEYGESLMGLRTGQRISIRDLLYGLILRSGNDAAHTLAIDVAGSVPRFVVLMNRYAAALGLHDTHYANPVGLDQKGNYSSARDLAALTKRLLEVPAFAKIADSREAVLRSVRPRRTIETINELLLMEPWVTGVKTGHTWGALYCLVGSGRRGGVSLISDVLGAPFDEERFAANLRLLEYGFDQYSRRVPVHAGQDLANPEIRYSGGALPLRAARSLAVGVRKGQKLDVAVRAPSEVEGPIDRGQRLGSATVFVDGRRAGTVSLRAGRAVPKASSFDRARDFVRHHPIPIAAAAFVILLAGLLLFWLLRGRRKRKSTRVNAK